MLDPPVSVANSDYSSLISHLQIVITVVSDRCIQRYSKCATAAAANENVHLNGCSNAATIATAIAYAGYFGGSINCLEHSFSCAKNNNQLFPLARY